MLGSDFDNLSYAEVNAAFIAKTATPEGISELNVEGTQYIRNTLKEYSIWRQVVPPVYKRPAELIPNLDNDTLYDIIWIEAEAEGKIVTFQGDGDGKPVFGPRAALNFGAIMSPMWEKEITELSAYRIPITKIIEENSIKYLHTMADLKLTLAALSCAMSNGNFLGYNNLAASGDHMITEKGDISKLMKLVDGKDRQAKFLLGNQTIKDDLFAVKYTEVGDKETWINGFKYAEVGGLALVTSVKSKVFKPSFIMVTTSPNYLGVYEILEEPNFYVKRENHRIQMQAREVEGFGFVNTKSIAVMDTNNDDTTLGYLYAPDTIPGGSGGPKTYTADEKAKIWFNITPPDYTAQGTADLGTWFDAAKAVNPFEKQLVNV